MANPIHIHISPRKPNAQSWTEIDFSRAEKQNGSGVIVQCEHKYKYKMNAVEEHWKQIRVNILAYQPISSSHHLFEGGCSCTKSLSTRDKGGEWTWPSNLNHGGALTSLGVTNRPLFGFKTTKAPSRFKLGLGTKIRTPQTFYNFYMGILGFTWPYAFECHFWLLSNLVHKNKQKLGVNAEIENWKYCLGLFGEISCIDGACTDIFLHN